MDQVLNWNPDWKTLIKKKQKLLGRNILLEK